MRSWMIALTLGLLPVALLPVLPSLPVTVVIGLAALLLPLLGGSRTRWPSGLLAGACVGLAYGQYWQAHRLASACEQQVLMLEGSIGSLPRSTRMRSGELRQRFEFTVDSLAPAACAGPRRVLLSWYDGPRLTPGQRWRLAARLKRPWGLANPGSFNMQAWYAGTGIHAVGTVRQQGAGQLATGPTVASLHHRLRQRVSDRLRSLPLSPEAGAILRAVTVADRSGLDYRLWSLLQVFGVNHLVVISGLHIGMVAGLGFLLGGLVDRICWLGGWRHRQGHCEGIAALLVALAYTGLAGFSLSTVRALSMLACFLLAAASGRRTSPWNALLWSALLVLLCNPLATLGSGFWLSFGAVAWLLWWSSLRPSLSRWRRFAGTHLFMSLAMLPLAGWWFGGASLCAALANMMLIPLVGAYVVPLALLGGICALSGLSVDHALWRLAAWPLESLLPLARTFADRHGDWLYFPLNPDLPALLLAVIALALLVVRGHWAVRGAAGVLLLPLLLPAAGDHPDTPELRLTVLDVGQGTSVLLRSGDRALLYDTGGGDPAGSNLASAVVVPYLRRVGVSSLQTLVLSHPDSDHSAGAPTLLNTVPVARVLYSSGPPPRPDARRCRAGRAWRWPGGVRFQVLAPAMESGLSSNNGSCVLRVEYRGHRLLLPGDIEADRERALVRYWGRSLRSDWLLAGHHGSDSSSSWTWLKSVQPGTVVVSQGYRNRFGHPAAEVVDRVRASGARLYDTASGGALEFTFRQGQPQVDRYRDRWQKFWK